MDQSWLSAAGDRAGPPEDTHTLTPGPPLTISAMAALECWAAEKIMSRASGEEARPGSSPDKLGLGAGGWDGGSSRLGKVASGAPGLRPLRPAEAVSGWPGHPGWGD